MKKALILISIFLLLNYHITEHVGGDLPNYHFAKIEFCIIDDRPEIALKVLHEKNLMEDFEAGKRDDIVRVKLDGLSFAKHRYQKLKRMILTGFVVLSLMFVPLINYIRKITKRNTRLNRYNMDFSSKVFHNLKTPIAVVLGYIHLIKEEEDPVVQMKYMADAENRMIEIKETIHRLSLLSTYEQVTPSIRLQRANIGDIIDQVVGDLNLIAKKKQIIIRVEPIKRHQGDWFLNSREIYQLFQLIIENAIKYSYDGGVIRITGSQRNDQMRIRIRDEGIGIPTEDLGNIFNKYYRGHNHDVIASTGLGLSIAKQIMEHHLGTIDICGSEGTTVQFTFYRRKLEKLYQKASNKRW